MGVGGLCTGGLDSGGNDKEIVTGGRAGERSMASAGSTSEASGLTSDSKATATATAAVDAEDGSGSGSTSGDDCD